MAKIPGDRAPVPRQAPGAETPPSPIESLDAATLAKRSAEDKYRREALKRLKPVKYL